MAAATPNPRATHSNGPRMMDQAKGAIRGTWVAGGPQCRGRVLRLQTSNAGTAVGRRRRCPACHKRDDLRRRAGSESHTYCPNAPRNSEISSAVRGTAAENGGSRSTSINKLNADARAWTLLGGPRPDPAKMPPRWISNIRDRHRRYRERTAWGSRASRVTARVGCAGAEAPANRSNNETMFRRY